MDETDKKLDLIAENFSEGFMRAWNRKHYCVRCGSVMRYDALGEYRCMQCGKSELDDYGKIRAFLEEHGSASAAAIEASTGVPKIIINELLERGKIKVAGKKGSHLKCAICGTEIQYGKICPACAAKQTSDLKGIYASGFVGEASTTENKRITGSNVSATNRPKPRMHTWVKRKK